MPQPSAFRSDLMEGMRPAITNSLQQFEPHQMRRPRFRSLHQERFHPYAGRSRTSATIDPMQTIDYGYDVNVLSRLSFAMSLIREESDDDLVRFGEVVSQLEGRPVGTRRRIAFVDLVIDFALAMLHRIRGEKDRTT
ncbi:hypothetical protein EW146_g2039 [Bondarzewia mesenterica]|uniref:Uncharacterized protein n=1 Tax=Bondarzewia mesenterica TaxID=1095465 RepID=A0A4S4M230_9AGAM|nr:hypothetical protein EW146_g2039 [Bondarzewia mesenterica]